jgi:hypothetical protein
MLKLSDSDKVKIWHKVEELMHDARLLVQSMDENGLSEKPMMQADLDRLEETARIQAKLWAPKMPCCQGFGYHDITCAKYGQTK